MITIQTQSDGVLFNFQDSTRYLYGDGSILTPYNSLTLIADESNVLTFRKSASNDIFITAGYDELGYSSKEEAINDLKTKLFKATGGGSESGITSGDVQTMIDNSLEDYYTDDEVDAALSGKASASDVAALQNEVAAKADTSAVTAVANDVSTVSGQVATKVNTTDFSAYSAATDARIAEDEEVTAAALNDLQENKADTSSVTAAIDAAISGKADTSAVTAVNDALTAHTANTTVHVTSAEKTAWNAKQDALYIYTEDNNLGTAELHSNDSSIIFNAGGASITANNAMGVNTFNVASTGVTINGENVATESYVDAATSGKADTSAVTAVNDALTAHTSDTGIHVSAQEKNAWNAKAEPYSAGTGIEISGNVISATGGGGSVTVDPTLDTGSTNPVANSAITQALENKLDASAYTPTDLSQYWTSAQTQTAIDNAKAYYISFATIATTGIRDEDWDGIVAAIDDHRPIYAGYPRNDGGILYYGVECMNKNVSNTQIVLTSSDDNSHYFYTFTKNGSNDYTFTSETRPYVTDAEKTAWNAKAEPYSAGTGIDITDNVISVTGGGGGATYSAGTNIAIDSANTINCTLPITWDNNNRRLAIGSNASTTNNLNNIAIGNNSSAGAMFAGTSIAIGTGAKANAGLSIAIGQNTQVSLGEGLGIGNAANVSGTTKMNLNNQIKVDTNNQVYIKDKTNTTDVCIQDAIAALGGLKFVKLTQSEYDQLPTKDNDTLYIITNVVS